MINQYFTKLDCWFFLTLFLCCLGGLSCGEDSKRPPQKVLMLQDDLGIQDLGNELLDQRIEDFAIEEDQGNQIQDLAIEESDDLGIEIDMSTVERWPSGSNPLRDYTRCRLDVDCYVGHGTCITQLTLNRSEGTIAVKDLRQVPGFETLEEGEGVCSVNCAQSITSCPQSYTLGSNVDHTPWTCQVVYVGDSEYGEPGQELPLDPLPSLEELQRGPPFGALCRPPLQRTARFSGDFCGVCDQSELGGCLPGSLCLAHHPFAEDEEARQSGSCLVPCELSGELDAESPCPMGFSCRQIESGELALNENIEDLIRNSFCFPIMGTCDVCLDRDKDGRGIGHCLATGSSAEDCDDQQPHIYFDLHHLTHPFPHSCGPQVDANCNGLSDEQDQVGVLDDGELSFGMYHCGACFENCMGTYGELLSSAIARCIPTIESGAMEDYCGLGCQSSRVNCNGDFEDGCEVDMEDENYLYVPDCDRDGSPVYDQGVYFACEENPDIELNDQHCQGIKWQSDLEVRNEDCDDANAHKAPNREERCDGLDNDCDGEIDEGIEGLGESCDTGAFGVCSHGVLNCLITGELGIETPLSCVSVDQAQLEICDHIDNDCDGNVDEQPEGETLLIAAQSEELVGGPCLSPLTVNKIGNIESVCERGTWSCIEGMASCVAGEPTLEAGALFDPIDGLDEDCDGFDGTLTSSLFVGGVYDNGADGSYDLPYRTLTNAIEHLKASQSPIYQILLMNRSAPIEWNSHSNLKLDENMPFELVGGFNSSWSRTDTKTSISIEIPTQDQIGQSDEHTVIELDHAGKVVLQGLNLNLGSSLNVDHPSVTALHCKGNCSEFYLKNIHLQLPIGAPGRAGLSGTEYRIKIYGQVPPPQNVNQTSNYHNLDGLDAVSAKSVLAVGEDIRPTPPVKYCWSEFRTVLLRVGGYGGNIPQRLPEIDSIHGNDYPYRLSSLIAWDFLDIKGGSGDAYLGEIDGPGKGGMAFPAIWKAICQFYSYQGLYDVTLCDRKPNGEPGKDASQPLAVSSSGADGNSGDHGYSGGGGGGSLYSYYYRFLFGWFVPNVWFHHANAGSTGATGGCGGFGGRGGKSGKHIKGIVISGEDAEDVVYPQWDQWHSLTISPVEGGKGGDGGNGEKGGKGGGGSATMVDPPYLTQVGNLLYPIEQGDPPEDLSITGREPSGKGGVGGAGAGGGGGSGGRGGDGIAIELLTRPSLQDDSNPPISISLFNQTYGFSLPVRESNSNSSGGSPGVGGQHGGYLQNAPSGSAGSSGISCAIRVLGDCLSEE